MKPKNTICLWYDGSLEEQLFPGDSTSNPAGNRGLYGVNLTYQFPLTNTGATYNTVDCNLRVRNTAEPYFGAAHVLSPGGYQKEGVPILIHRVHNPPQPNDVNGPHHVDPLIDSTTHTFRAIGVGVNDHQNLEIRVANGGAAATPFNLEAFSPRIIAEPVQGGGE